MIQVDPCRGCGRMVLTEKLAGLIIKCDPSPLSGHQAVGEIIRGGQLWRVTPTHDGRPKGFLPARTGEAGPLKEHHCSPQGPPGALVKSWAGKETQAPPCGPHDPVLGRPGGRCAQCGDPGF